MVASAPELKRLITRASELIKNSSHCVALTGAGISTPSGIPDFRSPGSGIWTRYSPMEVASLSAFRYHPERFYNWLRPFVKKMVEAEPNPAHSALARLEQAGFLKTVITQNIDALHQKAGSAAVIEVHGTLQTLSCPGCFIQIAATKELIESLFEEGSTPTCERCGKILKPDIILYEEQLPATMWGSARKEILACDLLLVLGSSLTVTPVSDLPYSALAGGAKVIIINRGCTHLDDQAAVALQGDLAQLLPIIADQVINDQS